MTKSWTQHITLTKRINNHFWIALEYWMVNSAILLRGKTSSPSRSLLHRVHNSQAVTTNNSTVWGWLRIRATKSEKEPWAVMPRSTQLKAWFDSTLVGWLHIPTGHGVKFLGLLNKESRRHPAEPVAP